VYIPFILGVLISIALIATLLAVLLEDFYGHVQMFAALGQSLAVIGAAVFAWWLLRSRNGRR
jgi:peptidoglycan biosynthesis protein MviN/MurJ (putative lipid II flippase)